MAAGVAVSRRRFLAGASGIVVATAVGGGQSLAQGRRPSLSGGRVPEGVISGDPAPRAITLWTRVAEAEGAGTVELEVARDRGFRRVVARELVRASDGPRTRSRRGSEACARTRSTGTASGRHPHVRAGDVRVDPDDRRPVATEFVGGSITSSGLGEGGGGVLPGADPYNPQTPETVVDLLRSSNPWAVDADFDHHGYGLVTANQRSLACILRRVDTVKRPSRTALPERRFSYRITRGRPSLLD